ncbi:glycogen synthase [Flavobacterium sp. Fl-77]|uniref:Glycogen synthase n=1 Tax=Flavobacterium flavipigmentatum TaxID=2893884 RepID=A0AAJ2SE94_9FLAO|nr:MULTISPECIES: glycogen synthase [unclassified Flavobacterium]MDX6182809.1 glycogen synthase [Flavobacterium sp. Fl-33]MDX6186262.1 glycogen synthase [Flavobacterium sp. Fl-77]UFH37949.1 glycogen synthase [Flavobacterium sp. F-70]
MEIFHISAECYPVAKVGGLADVVGALPKYQKIAGHHVRVVMPCYDTKFKSENIFETVYSGTVKLGSFNFPFSVLKETTDKLGYELYLIEIKELFDRPNVYGYQDDIERFVSFQIAALDWITARETIPDILNCHDHHTGLIPFMMQYCYKYSKIEKVKTAITIHNGLYQGQFGFDKLYYIPEFDLKHVGFLDWDYAINSLAVAVKCAHAVTTVSPSYLDEINVFANGLESLFNSVRNKSKGILNGIDIEVWDPSKDAMIEQTFSIKDFEKGKQKNKEKLCEIFELDATKPLFSFIGRLFEEKGGDLLPEASALALAENFKALNILILGSGNAGIEEQLAELKKDHKGNYNVFIGYNEELSHLIYAGSDFILMPSRVEPCGLNQMYSLRYGTVPIVRRTGGLKDTIIDFGDNGNGICHDQASVGDIVYSINRAVELYDDKESFNKIRTLGMGTDHSWESVCQEYIEIYNLIIRKNEI